MSNYDFPVAEEDYAEDSKLAKMRKSGIALSQKVCAQNICDQVFSCPYSSIHTLGGE